jgi:hypothetical protein
MNNVGAGEKLDAQKGASKVKRMTIWTIAIMMDILKLVLVKLRVIMGRFILLNTKGRCHGLHG